MSRRSKIKGKKTFSKKKTLRKNWLFSYDGQFISQEQQRYSGAISLFSSFYDFKVNSLKTIIVLYKDCSENC